MKRLLFIGATIISASLCASEDTVSVHIGIPEVNRQEVAQWLNGLLADEFMLYTKTLKYHWNVVGPSFGPLHALFKEQYEQLFNFIDDIAERARSIGHQAFGTVAEFSRFGTRIMEKPGSNPDSQGMLADLLDGHEAIIRHMRVYIPLMQQLGDEGTANLLIDIMEKHEKTAWMIRAHLEE